MLTGCATCDEVITRHRCTARPPLDSLAPGESWACPECWGTWTVTEEERACPECGHSRMVKTWAYAAGGRIDSAPRHQPYALVPLRNILPRASQCYRLASGARVHIRPGCRC